MLKVQYVKIKKKAATNLMMLTIFVDHLLIKIFNITTLLIIQKMQRIIL